MNQWTLTKNASKIEYRTTREETKDKEKEAETASIDKYIFV
jgi:hypothetical protein